METECKSIEDSLINWYEAEKNQNISFVRYSPSNALAYGGS